MARFRLEDFLNRNPSLIYIAGNLIDAEKVERILDEEGLDYAISIKPYIKTSLIGGIYQGLFIYVAQPENQKIRAILEGHGLLDTVHIQDVGD